jgi:hypothetical protein
MDLGNKATPPNMKIMLKDVAITNKGHDLIALLLLCLL